MGGHGLLGHDNVRTCVCGSAGQFCFLLMYSMISANVFHDFCNEIVIE